MQDFSSDATINNSMHGKNNKFSTDGCKMQGASKIITEISGSNVDITKSK